MKTQYTPLGLFLLGMVTFFTLPTLAQEDFTKELKESYQVSAGTSLSLENEYGNIDIKDWDKSTIEIKVEIILKDINQQRADKLFEQITIDFSQQADNISAKTNYDDLFFKQVNRTNHMGNNKFEVNYTVMLPAHIKVNVSNRYGSIFINKLASASKIDLRYGTLKINQLIAEDKTNMAELDLSYSKGTIESCEWLKLAMKYSKLDIQKGKALIVISKYSKLNVEQGSSLICESRYDAYEIGKLANFVAEAQYSNFSFDQLKNKLSLETKYTEVKIESIPAGFESISIDNSYGAIRIGIAPEANYELQGFAKYAKINYPDESEVSRFQENNELHLEGQVGPKSSSKGTVKIETTYGNVSLN